MISYYIKLAAFEYPRHEGDIRLEHPEILESQTGDTFPCPDTYAPVERVDPPEIADGQSCDAAAPTQDETGKWKENWVIRNVTPEEIQAAAQRELLMQQQRQQ